MTNTLTRRTLLTALPVSSVALAMPANADSVQDTEHNRMIDVIKQLEECQGWESSSTVAAKTFAAWQMRKALGLDLPDPKTAQMHIEFQRQQFEGYRHSLLFERDRAAGKTCEVARMERALG